MAQAGKLFDKKNGGASGGAGAAGNQAAKVEGLSFTHAFAFEQRSSYNQSLPPM